MKRLAPLLIIFSLYTYLAILFTDKLECPLDGLSFTIAAVVAGLTSSTWSLINGLWNTVKSPYRLQTITLETKETPNQITLKAFWAMVKLVFFITTVLVIAFYIIYVFVLGAST